MSNKKIYKGLNKRRKFHFRKFITILLCIILIVGYTYKKIKLDEVFKNVNISNSLYSVVDKLYFWKNPGVEMFNLSSKDIKKSDNTSNIKIPKESDTLTNILVICTVPSDNSLQNPPDKFSVLSLDSANNKILFTPIPLDISVDIPGIGSKKLSDTYSWGDNTDLLLEAIKSKFDTNITRVIEINTESISEMTEMFNEMGIDMTEEKLLEYLNETKVSKSMAEDIKSIPIFKYPKLISCMKPYIKTNMDTASLIKYGIITYKIVSHG